MFKGVLKSTGNKETYPVSDLREFAETGHALEVNIEGIANAQIKKQIGTKTFERYLDFLPFNKLISNDLGVGNTPLIQVSSNLYYKNETANPTWSFKDRGSWAITELALQLGESRLLTVSTGNMGNSTAAFGAANNLATKVIVPANASIEKIQSAILSGAEVIKVETKDFSQMKKSLALWAPEQKLRLTSGNNPIRVEGYKTTAFEIFEQLQFVPDYISIPSSACGHIRGVFKGFQELTLAGITNKIPKMIVLQAEGNNPLVNAIQKNLSQIEPIKSPKTIASAITSGNPQGGQQILDLAKKYHWLAEEVNDKEILEGQIEMAKQGFFVEPASATSYYALKKLEQKGLLNSGHKIVSILTGGGLKDPVKRDIENKIKSTNDQSLFETLKSL